MIGSIVFPKSNFCEIWVCEVHVPLKPHSAPCWQDVHWFTYPFGCMFEETLIFQKVAGKSFKEIYSGRVPTFDALDGTPAVLPRCLLVHVPVRLHVRRNLRILGAFPHSAHDALDGTPNSDSLYMMGIYSRTPACEFCNVRKPFSYCDLSLSGCPLGAVLARCSLVRVSKKPYLGRLIRLQQ